MELSFQLGSWSRAAAKARRGTATSWDVRCVKGYCSGFASKLWLTSISNLRTIEGGFQPGGLRERHPYFSRDGRTIVFQSPRANGEDTNIYVMNSDGSNVVQLTNLKGFAGVPVYSPDQKLIVLQWRETNNFDDDKKWRICVTNADGSNFRTITSGEANDQVPNWSRDGERLLFYSDRSGKNQIYTMKPDGSEVRQLVATRSDDNAAFWSPDNKKITFTSNRDGNSELYVMDADGKHVRRLTNTRATERAGVWSPDGKRIAFSSDGDAPSHVYLMNADGSKLVSLTGKAK